MAEPNSAALKGIDLCGETENSDEIPAYTEIPLTDKEIKEINIEKYAARRVMKLFISHLLDTAMVKIHGKLEKHFVIKDVAFRSIMIRGVIVGLQFHTSKTKERTLISVDDGTGVLDCFVDENVFVEDIRCEVHAKQHSTTEMFQAAESDNIMLKAALMLLQSAKERFKKIPSTKNFQLGDTVVLIGTFSEYFGKRSCFVSSIMKDDGDSADYLEHVQKLYEMYFKC